MPAPASTIRSPAAPEHNPVAGLKRSTASLIGGIGVGIFVLALWLLLAGTTSPLAVISGFLVAGLIGAWVRLADL